jgi:hypothetical protein
MAVGPYSWWPVAASPATFFDCGLHVISQILIAPDIHFREHNPGHGSGVLPIPNSGMARPELLSLRRRKTLETLTPVDRVAVTGRRQRLLSPMGNGARLANPYKETSWAKGMRATAVRAPGRTRQERLAFPEAAWSRIAADPRRWTAIVKRLKRGAAYVFMG